MNHIKFTFVTLFLLALASNPVCSQDNRTLETKVADLLVQIPADNQQQLFSQMNLLLQLEVEGLQKVLDMIIPPGTGDDTKPRVAVESLSRFLSNPGHEKEKVMWETMLLKEIGNNSDTYVQGFLMSQLNYIGGDATVKSLGKYLTDINLYDPAIRAMRDANLRLAANEFVQSLDMTFGIVQIALINAIGETGVSDHAFVIGTYTRRDNPELQRSVLACLAKLGNLGSYEILMDAAKEADYLPEPSNATESLLAFAETLSKNEHHRLSLKICKTILKKCSNPEQIHFKIFALITAAGNSNIESSISLLTNAMDNEHKRYRMSAINYAAKQNSPLAPWSAVLEKTESSEVKSEILFLFGLLKSQEAADVAKTFVKDPDAMVRQQAVLTLVMIRKDEALGTVLDYAQNYRDESELNTAKSALLQIVDQTTVPQVIDRLDNAPDEAMAIFLEVIAAKGNSDYFSILFDRIEKGGMVRKAALENLFRVTSYGNLNELLMLFDHLENEDEIRHIERAIVTSAGSPENRSTATRTILKYAYENSSIEKFIGVLAGVGGIEAMNALFEICSGSNPHPDKEAAFASYVGIVNSSAETNDQKLLLFRKIEPFAPGVKATTQLLMAVGNVKTFLSLIFVSKYLDHEEIQAIAANSVVNIVLPREGLNNGLNGQIVKKYLVMARKFITGPDSEYLRIDIDNYLEQMSGQEGFISMFNGKDLTGWQGLAADPIKKQKESPVTLKQLQTEANEKLLENWSVRDNCIVFNGNGDNLCSVKEYGSFEMVVDWRITKKGDSGIYLRGSPQVQIWDPTRVEEGTQVGSGGLYNNQIHESIPLVVADNPIGEWNTFHISMLGNKVTVYLNGQLVVDNVIMENYWDRNIPIFPTGSIELQAHGTDLAFRDIYINDLKSAEYNLSEDEKADGFVSLFNGKDLSGWTGKDHHYKVEDGTIVIYPEGSGGNLYTEKEYSDFIYRFEFKLTPGANNGLGIRTPMEGDAAYVGYELQIIDNTAPVYANLEPYQYHGSVYGIIPSKRGYLKPVGEWNSEEVIIRGDDIKVILNGTTIVDGNIREATKNGPADKKEHPGLNRSIGHIGYLGHGSQVWFRNIRIKEL